MDLLELDLSSLPMDGGVIDSSSLIERLLPWVEDSEGELRPRMPSGRPPNGSMSEGSFRVVDRDMDSR